MKRILVPVNFSNSSVISLQYAHFLTKHLGVEITLLHCYPAQEYNRPYDFGKKDYQIGIREMLKDFYRKHIDENSEHIRYLAQPGSVSEKVALISKDYEIIVLVSGNKFSSNVTRWLGSKASYIASKAQCPVLIIPVSNNFSGTLKWEKIWHIKRKENENEILGKKLPRLKIDPQLIEVKSFDQTAFRSAFWQAFVSYVKTPRKEMQQAILAASLKEEIDLIILVSHGKDSFENFMKNRAFQTFFALNIPVLILQAYN